MYLKLMALRFKDTFVYQVDIEEEAGEVETIAFWLSLWLRISLTTAWTGRVNLIF